MRVLLGFNVIPASQHTCASFIKRAWDVFWYSGTLVLGTRGYSSTPRIRSSFFLVPWFRSSVAAKTFPYNYFRGKSIQNNREQPFAMPPQHQRHRWRKWAERRTLDFLTTPEGFAVALFAVIFTVNSFLYIFMGPCVFTTLLDITGVSKLARNPARFSCSRAGHRDNIGGVDTSGRTSYGPIDVVYTWVNGSDPVWLSKKAFWKAIEAGEAPPPGSSPDGSVRRRVPPRTTTEVSEPAATEEASIGSSLGQDGGFVDSVGNERRQLLEDHSHDHPYGDASEGYHDGYRGGYHDDYSGGGALRHDYSASTLGDDGQWGSGVDDYRMRSDDREALSHGNGRDGDPAYGDGSNYAESLHYGRNDYGSNNFGDPSYGGETSYENMHYGPAYGEGVEQSYGGGYDHDLDYPRNNDHIDDRMVESNDGVLRDEQRGADYVPSNSTSTGNSSFPTNSSTSNHTATGGLPKDETVKETKDGDDKDADNRLKG